MLSILDTLRFSIFGESHGKAVGLTLEGLPAGQKVSEEAVQAFADRRRSRGGYSTARAEEDRIEFLSGLKDGFTTGAPLTAIIRNTNARSGDYEKLKNTPRPSHCDYAANVKYGGFCDLAGGGHFSGRLTAPLCIAGGVAGEILKTFGICAAAYIGELAGIPISTYKEGLPTLDKITAAHGRPFPILSEDKLKDILSALEAVKEAGDSVGGVVELVIYNVPAGLGGPLYEGLEGRLASMLYAIPAVKGVEFGEGFGLACLRGSEANDPFRFSGGRVVTESNRSGGINGGISNGMEITARIAFRPTPSIALPQKTVDLSAGTEAEIAIGGRHDCCIVPRAVVCAEAAANLVLLDAYLENNARRI